MADKVRCAVVGCGVIAPTHISCLAAVPEAELACLCDIDLDKARGLAARFADDAGKGLPPPRVTDDVAAVFADPGIDAVHVCTDHASHAPLTVAALAAGKHVCCEKPLASSPEGLQTMLDAHRRHADRVLMPIFQHRYEPLMRALRDILAAGLLGKLATATTQLHCHRSREYYLAAPWRGGRISEGGSVLINQAVHFFDILLFITGGVSAVQAMWANRNHEGPRAEGGIETEDTVTATLQLRNGALATFQATNASYLDWDPILALHGTEGSIEWRAGKIVNLVFRDPAGKAEARRRLAAAEKEVEDARARGVGKGYYGPGHPAQIADFIAAIREGRAPYVTPEMAADTMRALFAVYASAERGRRVEV